MAPFAHLPPEVAAWGFPGVFGAAFLAGSVFPVPSEAAVAALIASGQPAWLCVAVATAGNALGAATLYGLARYAARKEASRVDAWLQRRSDKARARVEGARTWLRRYGAPALILSWIPIVGDAFVLAAGAAGVRWAPFFVFVSLGKGLRYALVALTTVGALRAAG